jgi:L-fuconolactonase
MPARVKFPIIDTHVHLWDKDGLEYPWLADIPALNRNFLPGDYSRACGNITVEGAVFMQCEVLTSQSMDEARWVAALAKETPGIKAIVPWAPLEQGEHAREHIEKLIQYPLVKGIRRIIQFEKNPEFCIQPDFIRGVQMLADYSLSFDICISHVQMANSIRMVSQCAGVTFILDHIGKPDIKNHIFEPWATHLKRFSEFPNVYCKISGVITEADHEKWTKEDLKPYIEHVLNCFGFDRVIYGGDWPVVTTAGKYTQWVEALEWAISGCSEDELRKLFHDNVSRAGLYGFSQSA